MCLNDQQSEVLRRVLRDLSYLEVSLAASETDPRLEFAAGHARRRLMPHAKRLLPEGENYNGKR